jgi:hypothetical protein
VKASARFVSTVNHFGLGRSKVGRAATPYLSGGVQGTSARSRRTTLAAAATLLTSLALLLAAAPANAAPTAHPGYHYLAGADFGAAQNDGFDFLYGPPHHPIALDSHGNILIANQFDGTAAYFAPDPTLGGTFIAQLPLESSYFFSGIAVDPGTDAIYAQWNYPGISTGVKRYLSDGKITPTYTRDSGFEVPMGQDIAVDPTTHDLLAANGGAETISRYSTAGALLATISTPGLSPSQIAIGPDGTIYISTNGKVTHLNGAGVILGEIPVAGNAPPAVDQVTGELIVAVGNHLRGYSPTGQLLFEAPMPTEGIAGIAIDSGRDRLYAFSPGSSFAGNSTAYTFAPATYPGVETPTVSEITADSAHLSAEVDPGEEPGGGIPEGSELCFEYQPLGATKWEPGPCQSSSGAGKAEADLTNLEPNLDYLVRAVASNSLASHISDPTPFTTLPVPPKTVTGDATDVSETGAVLNGTINPAGLPSTYHFEYGTTTAYGSRVPAGIEAVAGNERTDKRFGRTITGLTPGTTYHFRLVAQNSAGVSQGADRTFTTTAVGGVTHRAYEQVTPVDKKGIPIWEGFGGFQAKADGSAISYMTQASSEGAPWRSRSISLRGGADWSGGIDLDPPLSPPEPSLLVGATTLAVSSDFTRSLVVTNRKLTPDAGEDGQNRVNLYVDDVATGARTLVGTAPSGLRGFIGAFSPVHFRAAAPDFSWIVFSSEPPLLPGAPETALYRWSVADGLEVVSVLPGGALSSVTLFNSSVCCVSADSSRIYFTVDTPGLKGLFLHEEGHLTKAISVSHIPGDPGTPHHAVPIGTSKDGRYAFFISDAGKLTSDAPVEGFNEGSTYRYDAADDSLEYLGAAYAGGNVIFSPIAVAEDGQIAYWTGPAESATGPAGSALVWHNGVVKAAFPWTAGSTDMIGHSPDGRYVAYAASIAGIGDVGKLYLYDSETDQRSCVSCLPDGSPGNGSLPSIVSRFVSNRIPQAVTDAGQVFFTTDARLVAADTNGTNDVYEYKNGQNRLISPGNAPFSASFADISEDGSNVFFTTDQKLVGQDNDKTVDIYDARIGGGLAKQNPPPPQECVRDDCKATPNAGPELPFGGSEALSGPGNVTGEARKRCAKGSHARKVKGKTRCVKQSKAKKKAKNTKRANTNRRQGR